MIVDDKILFDLKVVLLFVVAAFDELSWDHMLLFFFLCIFLI